MVFDFYARKFIETAVNNHFLNAFPIPDLTNSQLFEKLVSNVASLVDDIPEFKIWKEKVGTKPTLFEKVDDLISENDAIVARLYGLSEKQLIHIFTNFHRGWDYSTRLKLTLEYFGRHK